MYVGAERLGAAVPHWQQQQQKQQKCRRRHRQQQKMRRGAARAAPTKEEPEARLTQSRTQQCRKQRRAPPGRRAKGTEEGHRMQRKRVRAEPQARAKSDSPSGWQSASLQPAELSDPPTSATAKSAAQAQKASELALQAREQKRQLPVQRLPR